MTALLVYLGILLSLYVLTALPILGKFIHHLYLHPIGHVCHHHQHGFIVGTCIFLWSLILGLIALPAFGLWKLLIADLATILFLYKMFNPRH